MVLNYKVISVVDGKWDGYKTYNVCIVRKHSSKLFLPQCARPNLFQSIDGSEVENGNHAGQVSSSISTLKFVYQFLYTLNCTAR